MGGVDEYLQEKGFNSIDAYVGHCMAEGVNPFFSTDAHFVDLYERKYVEPGQTIRVSYAGDWEELYSVTESGTLLALGQAAAERGEGPFEISDVLSEEHGLEGWQIEG